MNRKNMAIMLIAALFSFPAFGGDDIELRMEDGPYIGSRSEGAVTASINDRMLTVSFTDVTASQIVVKDSANLTVFNQTYAPAYSAQADLTSLVPGYYTLYIYAMGYWWYGQFEIE